MILFFSDMVEPDMKDLELVASDNSAADLNVPIFLISSISTILLFCIQH